VPTCFNLTNQRYCSSHRLAQLKALYNERWESFLANAGVVQGFAPNDLTTADWMSRRTGQTTLIAANTSENLSSATGKKRRY
jgi:type IV secretory pathway TraG/TraD family ATPase VirD4